MPAAFCIASQMQVPPLRYMQGHTVGTLVERLYRPEP